MGDIAPGRSVSIEWRFSPLEAKTYMVDVPIRVHNGDTAIITFTGIGYDRRIMGNTMPLSETQDMSGVPSVQSIALPGQVCQCGWVGLDVGVCGWLCGGGWGYGCVCVCMCDVCVHVCLCVCACVCVWLCVDVCLCF